MKTRTKAKTKSPAALPGPARGDLYVQKISVPFEYPVHFTWNSLDPSNGLLMDVMNRRGEKRRHRIAFYIDDGVVRSHPGLTDRIKEYFHVRPQQAELCAPPQIVPGGMAAKTNWKIVQDVMWNIGNLHLDRQSYIAAVGGGSVLDMVGFATSIVHRGLRLIRFPTTTLAQADAGVGVKNGMDEHGQKNFVGTFAPPFAVINDFNFLSTQKFEDWLGGLAEAFKVAIIKDAAFFGLLCRLAGRIAKRDEPAMRQIVKRAAIIHLDHIRTGGDPFEFGSARPLDFGHWSAHKIELLSGYRISHGQAVAMGIALDSCYAATQGLISPRELDRIIAAMRDSGLILWSEYLDQRAAGGELEILAGLEQFREHLGGELTVTLPKSIGRKVEVHHVNAGAIETALAALRKKTGRKGAI
ncbi:MAG: 3-dehydroquinate synthase [Planctomycetes bacterium]|nr:3-dehydroquinate synthase [Planctomycetota bacterium]